MCFVCMCVLYMYIYVYKECMFDAWTEIAKGIRLMEQFHKISCDDIHTPARSTYTYTPEYPEHWNVKIQNAEKLFKWLWTLFPVSIYHVSLFLTNILTLSMPHGTNKGAKIVYTCGNGLKLGHIYKRVLSISSLTWFDRENAIIF